MNNSAPFSGFGLFCRKLLFLVLSLNPSSLNAQSDTTQIIDSSQTNNLIQRNKPYVILISVDGLRYDYARKYHADNLLRLGSQGAIAEYMIPSFPSLTFPNHYSLVTGLYPSHHGLVDNQFYDLKLRTGYDMHQRKKVEDGTWYGGTPLWVLAEQQKMVTASFYWVGSDASIQQIRPSYFYHYNEIIPLDRRIAIVRNWLKLPEEKRPHLITFYFPEVDHQGHDYGPDSKETENAVHLIDQSIGRMTSMIDSLHLAVNFIVVSDHGMAAADIEHPLSIPSVLRDTSLYKVIAGATLVHIYCNNKSGILPLYQDLINESTDYDVLLADKTPISWHYRKKDDLFGRIGDILLVTQFPKVFRTGTRAITPGKHGFDPETAEMRATFIAWGPQIKKSVVIKPFENVNVYPFVANLLGLRLNNTIDGNPDVLKPILK